MRQLISRFQRTSCTPRNITLNTPKYSRSQQQQQQEAPASVSAAAQHMMQEMLPGCFGTDWGNGQDSMSLDGAGCLEPLDPNCFEVSRVFPAAKFTNFMHFLERCQSMIGSSTRPAAERSTPHSRVAHLRLRWPQMAVALTVDRATGSSRQMTKQPSRRQWRLPCSCPILAKSTRRPWCGRC